MRPTRRHVLAASAAAGGIVVLPWGAGADGHAGHVFETPGGELAVHPVSHASFVMETPAGTIHVDPVGGAAAFEGMPAPDLILVTHRHGDHYDVGTLEGLAGAAPILTCRDVLEMMPEELAARAEAVGHDAAVEWNGFEIGAIPAYNLTEARQDFHPKARGDNGFVLGFEGFRVYISGDTEDIPEMRALTGIDLAFVCMNLPFTMTAEAAADAVREFAPAYVYPYHWRGRDGGTQDPEEFASLVGDAAEVTIAAWYGG